MNHAEALEISAVEKYALGELTPELREAFEEHFFDCPACAADVLAATVFMDEASRQFEEHPAPIASPRAARVLPFLRPVLLIPALAASLLVVAYQNIVTYPSLKQQTAALNQPQVLASLPLVNGISRGEEQQTIAVRRGQPYLLAVDLPADGRFPNYLCSLYAPSGKKLWQLTVSSIQARDTLPIRVPAADATEGVNSLAVQGIGSDPTPVNLATYRFNVKLSD